MPELLWDQVGKRTFQTGVDRGVLYLADTAVAWNGLTGVEEEFNQESNSFYLDGVKYLDHQVLGEFSGKLKAFTYPEKFEDVGGVCTTGLGVYVHDQQPKSFGLSYRTKIGNDLDADAGYRIHLLYNLRAVPDTHVYSSQGAATVPVEFAWSLSSTPVALPGRRPTAHISIKSTDIDPGRLAYFEGLLYGTAVSEAYLPSLPELVSLIENPVVVIDNGDGTWTATGSSIAIQMLNPTTFTLVGVVGDYLDANTYSLVTAGA